MISGGNRTALMAFVLVLSFVMPQAVSAAVIEEIIVTAQKREESLQEVPIAVSAFSGDFIEETGIDDLLELQQYTPGLGVGTAASNVTTTIFIRGLGTTGGTLAFESGVGVYIDGVYRSRQTSAINDLIDLERVEVLKGPQGTLFGRNTVTGAIQYVTRAPEQEFGGWAEVQAGNLDYVTVRGAVNVPVIDNVLATRFSGSVSQREGYVDNLFLGTEVNERERYQFRAQALYTPTDDISLRLIADVSQLDEACCANGVFIETGAPQELFFLSNSSALPASSFHEDEYITDQDPVSLIDEWGVSGELTWDFDTVTFVSQTAYREFDLNTTVDADFTTFHGGTTSIDGDQWSFSQEFRLHGSAARLEWVAGVHYYEQEFDQLSTIDLGPNAVTTFFQTLAPFDLNTAAFFGLIPGVAPQTICPTAAHASIAPFCALSVLPEGSGTRDFSTQNQSSWAAFGQLDFDLTDRLVATLGLRYNSESKEASTDFGNANLAPGLAVTDVISPITVQRDNIVFDDDAVSGTAKLTYFPSDLVMTYLSYGRGYKAGGTNVSRLQLTVESRAIASAQLFTTGTYDPSIPVSLLPDSFGAEESESWEAGVKSDLLGARLRLNATVFHTKFDNLQLNQFDPDLNTFVIRNAAALVSQGLELEAMATPTDWLTLTAAYAYVDAYYDSFPGGTCGSQDAPQMIGCDNTDRNAQGTPENSISVTARITQDISPGLTGYAQLDADYRDETFYGSENDPIKTLPSRTLVNLRMGATFMDGKIDVSVWGKNVFDREYATTPLNSSLGSIIAGFTEPPTYGVTLRSNF